MIGKTNFHHGGTETRRKTFETQRKGGAEGNRIQKIYHEGARIIGAEMNQPSDKVVGCDVVNEHISMPIPATLWHYTSYAGFQAIVTSKRIWATEYRFLNDREEFLHARELGLKLVDEEPEYVGQYFPARDTLRQAVDGAFQAGYLQAEKLHIMVASFSEEGDQLSQWRGYAENSRGVSMGLDLRNIRPPLDIGTAVTFAPCVYKQADKTALLKAIFAHFRNRLQEWWDSIMNTARTKQLTDDCKPPQFGQQLSKNTRRN